eukprot:tig00020563_g11292.t1
MASQAPWPPLVGPVRAPIDEAKLAAHLRAAGVPGLEGSLRVGQFSHGQSNPTYFVQAGEHAYVLRKKPAGKLLPSAHAVEREFRVMRALGRLTTVPVPEAILLCEDPAVIGTPFFLMRYERGRLFQDPSLPGMEPAERAAVYESMGDTLAKLHAVDCKALGLADYGRVDGYSRRQVARWTAQYEASKTGTIEAMDRLAAWLAGNVPPEADSDSCLVHGDFRLDNLVFHPTQPRVIAVLDWELSTLGHPLSDLAYNCLTYFLPPSFRGYRGFAGRPLPPGVPDLPGYAGSYLRRRRAAGLSELDAPSLRFYIALSFFRGAGILQGVYKRSLQGNASAANAAAVGAAAAELAAAGLACALGPPIGLTLAPATGPSGVRCHGEDLRRRLLAFMDQHVYPSEKAFEAELEGAERGGRSRWDPSPTIERLKALVKQAGLWNLWLPPGTPYGPGLSNAGYAPLAEIMGRSPIAPEAFNCSAPDTGNMEVLLLYGSDEQKKRWLVPLLEGSIRSMFGMTEPAVASSDATNMEASILPAPGRPGYLEVSGRKWWSSGAGTSACKVAIVMGRSAAPGSGAPRHKQHSMVLVPMDSPGVKILRPLKVFGYDDAPAGHCEVVFENVIVPESNLILGAGRGFEIAQGRLGPGRMHHCMRLIGLGERSLELACRRALSRRAFGRPLAEQGALRRDIAASRAELDQARLLVLDAAGRMDAEGNRAAAGAVALAKAVVPSAVCRVVDRAIQIHGGAGVSEDFPLAQAYAAARTLRIADGPDEARTPFLCLPLLSLS